MMYVTKESVKSIESFCSQLLVISQKQLTGRLELQNEKREKWSLYFNLGRLAWVTTAKQNHRRWQRLMCKYCPGVAWEQVNYLTYQECESCHYQLLSTLAEKQLMTSDQVLAVIKASIVEILFDIFQSIEANKSANINVNKTEKLPCLWDSNGKMTTRKIFQTQWFPKVRPSQNLILPPFYLLDVKRLINQTFKEWQDWIKAGLTSFSPNLIPIIKYRKTQENNDVNYQELLQFIGNQHTLRELELKNNNWNLIQITQFMLPYVRQNIIELVLENDTKIDLSRSCNLDKDNLSIISIGNNPRLTQILGQVTENYGYQFVSIKNELLALQILLKQQPDLVFINRTMSIMNGYEICAQIRRSSSLKKIPVIMFTDHDNLFDRARAKITGVNNFVEETINYNTIQKMIGYYQSQKFDLTYQRSKKEKSVKKISNVASSMNSFSKVLAT